MLILGPLLFLFYFNNLPDHIINCDTFLCADNTDIIASGSASYTISDQLNTAMSSASNWLDINKLSLNISKTKTMLLGTGQKISRSAPLNVLCKGKTIEKVLKFIYLGSDS